MLEPGMPVRRDDDHPDLPLASETNELQKLAVSRFNRRRARGSRGRPECSGRSWCAGCSCKRSCAAPAGAGAESCRWCSSQRRSNGYFAISGCHTNRHSERRLDLCLRRYRSGWGREGMEELGQRVRRDGEVGRSTKTRTRAQYTDEPTTGVVGSSASMRTNLPA